MFYSHNSQRAPAEEETSYWISYSDLMAALLLVFILLLLGSLFVSKGEFEEKEQELIAKEQALQAMTDELEALDTSLKGIVGVRGALMERLSSRFSSMDAELHFDDATGAIQLGSGILFDEGSARLSEDGRRMLTEFIPIYFESLLGDEGMRPYIEQIVFEGHTNSNYSGGDNPERAYLFNLRLSQDRAYEAMEYVIANDLGKEYAAEKLLAAVGYSSSRLIYREDTPEIEDEERSRRLEIRFRLKDEESMEELRRLIEQER